MCKVPTPDGWTMNPEQVQAIIEFAKAVKSRDAGTFTKQTINKCLKEGYIVKVGSQFSATDKAKDFLADARKRGEEETARRKEEAKAKDATASEQPRKEGEAKAKGRAKAPEDLRIITKINKEEPKFQAGADRANHWKMIETGMTVSEFLSKGGIKVSLLVFEQRGLIRLSIHSSGMFGLSKI